MADRYPLVYNPSANQLQELQSGDSLDAGGTTIKNAVGYSTAGGTSSQFLKADGSTDSNTYLTSTGTVALAEGLTGSPSITVSAVSGTNGTFFGNISAVNVSASSSVTAATFYGDGQNLTNTGSTLSASSATQRVVLTGQTSGTMTSSATDSDLTYDSSSNTLNVQNLNVQGTTTTIDTAVTDVDSLAVDGNITAGGDVNIADKIVHTSDTDTAIRFPAADTFTVETAGSERLRITSAGLVGIGTDNPESALHVVGSIPNAPTKFGVHVGAHSGYGLMQFTSDTGGIIDFGESGVDSAGRIIYTHSDDTLKLQTANAERLRITSDGHILPGADNTQDLGSSAKRFANIYTGDLNLSNEGSANDVDGTWGNYTIQEGEDDLFLINKRTGKKYKFNLTEVD